MGVHDFFKIKFNNKTIAELGQETPLKKLNNERVCIDASLMIYNTILATERMQAMTDGDGKITAHIKIIFEKIIQLAEAGIDQLWIFDSPTPNKMKEIAAELRSERRKTAEEATTITEEQKQKRTYRLNTEHVNEIKDLLNTMGVRWVEAPPGVEAEQYGAFLTKGEPEQRFCKYMITTDSDLLLFGGNMLRIGATGTGKTKRTAYFVFELRDLLTEMNITQEQLIKIGVTLGTDFNVKTPGIGPGTVVKKVKDGIFYTPRQEEVIEYYKSDITGQVGESKIMEEPYNRENVIAFLQKRNFNTERVNKRLNVYEKFRK